MKTWFTSRNGALTLSALSLLSFIGYVFLMSRYFLADSIPGDGAAMAATLGLMLLIGGLALLQGIGGAPDVGPPPSTVIAAGSGAGTQMATADEDLEALLLRHQALALTQALSDDAGVHMVSFTY